MQEQIQKYSYIPDVPKNKRYVVINIVLFVIILLLLTVIIVFSTALTTMTVSGDSMLPNLKDEDRLVILKYGYELDYGDIVVFSRSQNGSTINAVKRVIAKQGDTIRVDKDTKQWFVNDVLLEEPYFNGQYSIDYFDYTTNTDLLGDGITIPEGYLFVLGDNRNIANGNVSVDSHIYGPIPLSSLIGKVIRTI